MRCILILRHAEAVAHSPGGDLERELSTRGRVECGKVGHYIARNGLFPDLAVVSPSARTRETFDLVQQTWTSPVQQSVRKGLYNAEVADIVAELRQVQSDVHTLLYVGHNPGIAEFANLMVARGQAGLRDELAHGMPTASLAVLDLDIEDWVDLSLHSARLVSFVTPDKMAL